MSIYEQRGQIKPPFFIFEQNKKMPDNNTLSNNPYPKDTVGYMNQALKDIKLNPNNHGYPTEEVERINSERTEFNRQIRAAEDKAAKNYGSFAHITKLLREAVQFVLYDQQNISKYSLEINKKGWYLSPNVFDEISIPEFTESNKEKNAIILEKKIIDMADNLIPDALDRCLENFPNRENILNEIYKAYTAKLYSAVVLICYSQADGICYEILNQNLYKIDKNKNQLKIANELEQIDSYGLSGLFDQLGNVRNELTMNSFDTYFEDEEITKTTFNRHKVIHGNSIHYGTRENAIRAVYMLDYISSVIAFVKDQINNHKELIIE